MGKYGPNRITRPIALQDAMKGVDEWFNSDDTWVTDSEGNKIEGGMIRCNTGSLLNKFLSKMILKKEENGKD